MTDLPPKGKKKKSEHKKDNLESSDYHSITNRIVIIEEREIPFEEERPPNYSPHFEVKVHRTDKKPNKEEPKE